MSHLHMHASCLCKWANNPFAMQGFSRSDATPVLHVECTTIESRPGVHDGYFETYRGTHPRTSNTCLFGWDGRREGRHGQVHESHELQLCTGHELPNTSWLPESQFGGLKRYSGPCPSHPEQPYFSEKIDISEYSAPNWFGKKCIHQFLE